MYHECPYHLVYFNIIVSDFFHAFKSSLKYTDNIPNVKYRGLEIYLFAISLSVILHILFTGVLAGVLWNTARKISSHGGAAALALMVYAVSAKVLSDLGQEK